MIKAIDVQFQLKDAQSGAFKTVDVHEFEEAQGEIEYDRATIFDNGSRHITLCKALEDVNWITCGFCGETADGGEAIHTEDGYTVGECCRDELRVVACDEQGETWYYAN